MKIQKTRRQSIAYLRYAFCVIVLVFVAVIGLAQMVDAAPKRKATAKPAPNPRYAAIVIDANNGKTLYQENANARRFPASLTKMMTLYMLFEMMQAGRIAPETPIPVSEYAAARPPTKIGFKPGQTISAEAAVKALITRSANDVASAVAEYLGGSETRFASNMTKKAHQLGMMNTNFANASGLPNNNNYSTARDMAILSLALREHFPQYYHFFNTSSFVFRGQTIHSHNRLVRNMKGVDGIKTGFISASGFNVATSMRSEGRSLVAVVMGGRTSASRDEHMRSLLNRYIGKATTKKKTAPLIAKAPPVAGDALPVRVAQIPLPDRKAVPIPIAKADIMIASQQEKQKIAIGTVIEADNNLMAFAAPPQKPETAVLKELEHFPESINQLLNKENAENNKREQFIERSETETSLEQVIAQSDFEKIETIGSEIEILSETVASSDEQEKQPQEMPKLAVVSKDINALENISDREHDALLIAALAREYPGSEPSILAPNPLLVKKEEPEITVASGMHATPSDLDEEQEIDIFTTASISNGKKGWVIQVATTKTIREADIALYKALNAASERLEYAEPYLQLHDEGQERHYRARFAGFKSQKSALNSCVALQSKAIDCFVFED